MRISLNFIVVSRDFSRAAKRIRAHITALQTEIEKYQLRHPLYEGLSLIFTEEEKNGYFVEYEIEDGYYQAALGCGQYNSDAQLLNTIFDGVIKAVQNAKLATADYLEFISIIDNVRKKYTVNS